MIIFVIEIIPTYVNGIIWYGKCGYDGSHTHRIDSAYTETPKCMYPSVCVVAGVGVGVFGRLF